MAERVRSLKTDIKFKDTPIGKVPIDWNVVTLKNIASKFLNGGTPDTTRKEHWDGNIPWITGADFENQKVDQVRKYITKAGLQNSSSKLVEKGNLLVVTRTGVGKIAIAPFDIAISQDITGIYLDNNKASAAYVYWYLAYYADKLRKIIQGTSINGLLREDLGLFNLSLPPLAEQLKIAEIFATSDAAIEKTVQIIEKTKELKKGLMQNLLTRGIGHTKFKKTEIGEIPQEWEASKLSDIAKVIMGQSPPGKTYNSEGRGCPILNGPTEFTDYSPVPIQYTSAPTKQCEKNDILFCVRGSSTGRMNIADRDYCIGRGLAAIRNKSNSDIKFIHYTLINMASKIYAEATGAGSTFPNISRESLEKNIIACPPYSEQKLIANILSSSDEELKNETICKERQEILKKGLMQILLTGKIRVNA